MHDHNSNPNINTSENSDERNSSIFSEETHSFDTGICAIYGMEEAVLIKHFLHWIRINKRKNTNFHDGRTWTYQTRKDMQAHFPYWNYDKIKYLCEKLVKEGILITGNYNKSKIDRTLWYAFNDEKKFGISDENEKMFTKRQKCPMNGQKCPTNTRYYNTDISNTYSIPQSIENKSKEQGGMGGPELKAKKPEPPKVSADASSLAQFFLDKIKERNPKFSEPNVEKWASQMERILRIDKRSVEELKQVIEWASRDRWYKSNCLSPDNLRKNFDMMFMKMADEEVDERERKNREFIFLMKEKHPLELKFLAIGKKYITHTKLGKDIPLNLEFEVFKSTVEHVFGGQ